MNSKEAEQLLNNIKNGVNLEDCAKEVNSLIGASNSWENVKHFIEDEKKNKAIDLYRKISGELSEDQCFSYSTHVIYFIKELNNIYNMNHEEAYKKIYSEISYDDFDAISKAIDVLSNINDKIKF